MEIRRLDPISDGALLRQAFAWDSDAPSWYQDSDSVFRPGSVEKYLEFARNEDQVDVGIFNGEMIGLMTFDHKKDGIVEVRLSAKRGASIKCLTEAAYQLRHQFFSLGMAAGFIWVAKRNYPVIRLCETIGFVRDGLTMYRGVYRKVNRPVAWVRMVTTREQWLAEQEIAA